MQTETFERIAATYTLETLSEGAYTVRTETDIKSFYEAYKVFDTVDDAMAFINKTEKQLRVMAIMHEFSSDMSTDHWHGSNLGMSEDNFEDCAMKIMETFDLK